MFFKKWRRFTDDSLTFFYYDEKRAGIVPLMLGYKQSGYLLRFINLAVMRADITERLNLVLGFHYEFGRACKRHHVLAIDHFHQPR